MPCGRSRTSSIEDEREVEAAPLCGIGADNNAPAFVLCAGHVFGDPLEALRLNVAGFDFQDVNGFNRLLARGGARCAEET